MLAEHIERGEEALGEGRIEGGLKRIGAITGVLQGTEGFVVARTRAW